MKLLQLEQGDFIVFFIFILLFGIFSSIIFLIKEIKYFCIIIFLNHVHT